MAECDLKIKKSYGKLFLKKNMTIPLNISLFFISKTIFIYSLSFLFISSQKYIKLGDMKIYKIIFRVFIL